MNSKLMKLALLLILVLGLSSCIFNNDPDTTGEYILLPTRYDTLTVLINMEDDSIEKTWESDYEAMGPAYLSENKTLLRLGINEECTRGEFKNNGGVAGIIEEIGDDSEVLWFVEMSDDSNTFHHDFKEIDENTIIALSWGIHEHNGTNYWDERIVIIDKSTKDVIWEWSAWEDGGLTTSGSVIDYLHFNSIDYKDGQVLVSARAPSTMYVIDRATKAILKEYTASGTAGYQHDATFLDNGNILFFNNQTDGDGSAVVEIDTSDQVVWEYEEDFSSGFMSGCQRLENGNTLVCSSVDRLIREVTPSGTHVWEYNTDPARRSFFKVRKYLEY